jgi:hypothetical protein
MWLKVTDTLDARAIPWHVKVSKVGSVDEYGNLTVTLQADALRNIYGESPKRLFIKGISNIGPAE